MDGELVLWVLLPLMAAVVQAALSVYSLCRDFRAVQILLGLPAVLLDAAAAWVLVEMLAGAWPTFLPHLALVLVIPLIAAQIVLMRARRRAEPGATADGGGM